MKCKRFVVKLKIKFAFWAAVWFGGGVMLHTSQVKKSCVSAYGFMRGNHYCHRQTELTLYSKETGTPEPRIKSLISAAVEKINVVILSNYCCFATNETILHGIKGEKKSLCQHNELSKAQNIADVWQILFAWLLLSPDVLQSFLQNNFGAFKLT